MGLVWFAFFIAVVIGFAVVETYAKRHPPARMAKRT